MVTRYGGAGGTHSRGATQAHSDDDLTYSTSSDQELDDAAAEKKHAERKGSGRRRSRSRSREKHRKNTSGASPVVSEDSYSGYSSASFSPAEDAPAVADNMRHQASPSLEHAAAGELIKSTLLEQS